MELKEMTMEQIEERRAAIAEEVEQDGADLDALETEARSLKEEIEARKSAEAKKAEIRSAVAQGKGEVVKKIEVEEKKVKTLEEVRASKEYAEAYKNYIIKEDATECRSLLTEFSDIEGASGPVPVPLVVDGIVRTAWERDEIMSRVRRTYIRGVLRVAFEYSATPADFHFEGTEASPEETLVLGIVQMVPANIKKWITISDEAITMGGEDFLRYVYDELTYQIVRFLAGQVVSLIADIPWRNTGAEPIITAPTIGAATPGLATIPTAYSYLSDEAANPVIIMNKLTYAKFIEAQAAASFAFDPFMGLPVLFSSNLPSFDEATGANPYAIVGDLNGVQVNFPEGDDVIIKYDDLSLAQQDLVKMVGRLYAAVAVTTPGRFVRIAKVQPSDG